MPSNTKYIGRGSKYGNPFRVEPADGKYMVKYDGNTSNLIIMVKLGVPYYCDTKQQAVKYAIECYREYAKEKLWKWANELKTYDLACWCPEGQSCHGDVLIEAAKQYAV